MHRDTKYAYRGWTIDVYRSVHDGTWCADWCYPGSPDGRGSATACRKKEAEHQAEAAIDAWMKDRQKPGGAP